MEKKKNKLFMVIIISFFALFITMFFLLNYLKEEREKYTHYNDFNRASIAMVFTFMRDLDSQYSEIRHQQRYIKNNNNILSKGDLIYDFSKYNIIPILNYLNSSEENSKLFDSFSKVLKFTEIYTIIQFDKSEDIFVKNNNSYFVNKNDEYIYTIKKRVISKQDFNDLYYDFKQNNNIDNIFINLLYNNEFFKNRFSKQNLTNQIKNNYNQFYLEYKDKIIDVISEDLENFSNYLNLFIDEPSDTIIMDPYNQKEESYNINLDIKGEEIKLEYKFKKVQKIYNDPTKYSNWLYSLDLKYLWAQLKEYEYPVLYQ